MNESEKLRGGVVAAADEGQDGEGGEVRFVDEAGLA